MALITENYIECSLELNIVYFTELLNILVDVEKANKHGNSKRIIKKRPWSKKKSDPRHEYHKHAGTGSIQREMQMERKRKTQKMKNKTASKRKRT